VRGTEAETRSVAARKGAAKRPLGPATVVRPCLLGAAVLAVVQTAMRVLLGT
jgi:hypothetical protein